MMLQVAEMLVVAAPAMFLALMGLGRLFRFQLSEKAVANCSHTASLIGLISALGILVYMLSTNVRDLPVELGNWVTLSQPHASPEKKSNPSGEQPQSVAADQHASAADTPEAVPGDVGHGAEAHGEAGHFHFRIKFVYDRLSIPFAIMSLVLCGVIGAFAFRYLHLEPGFDRFFMYYAIFQLGMVVSSLAGTIETLFFGWELVGLSSALLVAYFHDRPSPVKNGLRIWAVYRIADAAFLVAALTLHHLSGSGDFEAMMGHGDWPYGVAALTSGQALLVGSLLLIAVAGKSALVPFSGWLPRAMEGPTPSSAVFYGALSVHLGAFLLLRVGPMLEKSQLLCGIIVALGAVSLLLAIMVGRVQTDVKSALAFASLAQVSIITIEIGLGLRYIPLIHIIGHACIRTLQLVRAPSLLKDINVMENAIGERLSSPPTFWHRWLPVAIQERLYRFSWERGYLDTALDRFIVNPFVRLFRLFDRLERGWAGLINGEKKPNSSAASTIYEKT